MSKKQSVQINVDASQIMHTMKGGMGASWHALHHDIPLKNETEKLVLPARSITTVSSYLLRNNDNGIILQ
jgi:hypothetical protein